jgi:hypothetical protein
MSKSLLVERPSGSSETAELIESILLLDVDMEMKVAGLVATARARDMLFEKLSANAPKRRGRPPKKLPEETIEICKNPFDLL